MRHGIARYQYCIGFWRFAAVTVVVAIASCSRPPQAPKKSTEVQLRSIETAIEMLRETNHCTVTQQFLAIPTKGSPEERWELLLRNNTCVLGITDMEFSDIKLFCRDVWRRRFNVALKTNLPTHASSHLLNKPLELVVWSSGANGKNEFGKGDDVVLPLPTETILKSVEATIKFLEEENDVSIRQQFVALSSGIHPKYQLERLLRNNTQLLGPIDIEFLCRDEWGRQFNVSLKTDLPTRTASHLLNKPFQLVVWSSGSNGMNEFGAGDDVVLHSQPAVGAFPRFQVELAPD